MELPAVAGHTLTARRGLSLLLVGGYSPENGFNQQLFEYQLVTGTWVSGAQSGTPPTGRAGDKEETAPWTPGRPGLCGGSLSTAVPCGHCPLDLVMSPSSPPAPMPAQILRPAIEKFSFP